jgi:hypothetical protein
MSFLKTHLVSILAAMAAVLLVVAILLLPRLNLGKNGDESARVSRAVSELAIVPDETPIVTTVTDPAKLADTPLAGEAKIGDKVLFYQEAKRAILYRPSENRIVDMVRLKVDAGLAL